MNVPQTTRQNLPANESNYNPYVAFGDSVTQSNIVGHLLKFTKFGDWEAGENSVNIPHGTELIAHMGDVLVGWQKWQDSKPTEQVMGLVRENFQPPKRQELSDYQDRSNWEIDSNGKERDPWQRTTMLILKGVDDDELYTFSTSSKGGIQAVGRLSREYGHAMRMRPDEFPIVKLGWGSYEHSNKQFGEIRFPTFEIVGWVPRDEIDRALESKHGGGEQQSLALEPEPAQPRNEAAPGRAAPSRRPGATEQRTAPVQAPRSTATNQDRKTRF